MDVKGLEQYCKMIDALGKNAPEVAKKAVYVGANVVASEIKKRLIENLNDPSYVGKGDGGLFGTKKSRPTGDLLEAFGIAPIATDSDGNTNTKVGFGGYDQKGVPNALKARAMESGTSKLKKRPFVRPAVNATRKKAQDAMGKKTEEEIAKIYSL